MLGFVDLLTKEEKDKIASLISMDRKSYEAFEEAYKFCAIDGPFGLSAKDVVSNNRVVKDDLIDDPIYIDEICDRITSELLAPDYELIGDGDLVTNRDHPKICVNLRCGVE